MSSISLNDFYYLCYNNQKELINQYVEDKSWLLAKTISGGLTPFHIACKTLNRVAIESIIDSPGINLNACDKNGDTPLHYLARYLTQDEFKKMSYNTLRKVFNCSNITPAIQNYKFETPLHTAGIYGNKQIAGYLLEKFSREEVNLKNYVEETAYQKALEKTDSDIGRIFLLSGKVSNQRVCSDSVNNPLYLAIHAGNLDMVKALINIGRVDLNEFLEDGNTPLTLAAGLSFYKIMETLINTEGGAKLNVKNLRDKNVLNVLVEKPYVPLKAVEELVAHGADANQLSLPELIKIQNQDKDIHDNILQFIQTKDLGSSSKVVEAADIVPDLISRDDSIVPSKDESKINDSASKMFSASVSEAREEQDKVLTGNGLSYSARQEDNYISPEKAKSPGVKRERTPDNNNHEKASNSDEDNLPPLDGSYTSVKRARHEVDDEREKQINSTTKPNSSGEEDYSSNSDTGQEEYIPELTSTSSSYKLKLSLKNKVHSEMRNSEDDKGLEFSPIVVNKTEFSKYNSCIDNNDGQQDFLGKVNKMINFSDFDGGEGNE